MKKIVTLRHGYISIPDYNFGDSLVLQNYLSEYNEIAHKRDYIGLNYNEETKELRVPVGVGINLVSNLLDRTPEVDFLADAPRKISINLAIEPRDNIQIRIIRDITERYKEYSQNCIEASTGIGKTYCAIASLCHIKMATMIISHTSKLRSHWFEKLMNYTDLDEKDILIMDSSKNIIDIFESGEYRKYKVFTCTHQTLTSLGKKMGYDFIGNIFNIFGIGLCIIDEVHRFFRSTIRILTNTNTKKYLLLTATFKRSSKAQNRIFQLCFQNVPKFIQSKIDKTKKQGHIDAHIIQYNNKPDLMTQLDCEVMGMFNTKLYCNYLVDKDPDFKILFMKFATVCIRNSKDFDGIGLVFCGSINATEKLANWIKEEMPDIKVGIYHSKINKNQEEKNDILSSSDVIFTTSGSLSEGADIPNLHFIIDIESYKSEILSEQIPGRLRNLDDGYKFNYIKIVNIGFNKVSSHISENIRIYQQNMKSVTIHGWKNPNTNM